MSAVATKPRAKSAKKAQTVISISQQATAEFDWTRGRDIAVSLLREARQMVDTDQSSARRWHRDGKPQKNFVYGYLTDIIEDPSKQRGFSAVLSAAIGADMIDTPDFFADIPMAEYQAGEAGEDGTETEEDVKPAETRVAASALVSRSHVFEGDKPHDVIFHALARFDSAREIVNLRVPELDSPLVHALRSLMENCAPRLEALAADGGLTEAKIIPVHDEMDVIEGLMNHAYEDSDDPALWGAIYWMRLALEMVEDATVLACETEKAAEAEA